MTFSLSPRSWAQRVGQTGRAPEWLCPASEEVRALALLAAACLRSDRQAEAEMALHLAEERSRQTSIRPHAAAELAMRQAEWLPELGFQPACQAVRVLREVGDATDQLAWAHVVRGRVRTDGKACLDWLSTLELATLNSPRGQQAYRAALGELFAIVDSSSLLHAYREQMYFRLGNIARRWRRICNSPLKMRTFWLRGRTTLALGFSPPAIRCMQRARRGLRRLRHAADFALVSLDLARAMDPERPQDFAALAADTRSVLGKLSADSLVLDLELLGSALDCPQAIDRAEKAILATARSAAPATASTSWSLDQFARAHDPTTWRRGLPNADNAAHHEFSEVLPMLNRRQALALKLRKQGNTFHQIGEALGVGASGARRIYLKAKQFARILQAHPWAEGLKPGIAHTLLAAGLDSRNEVQEESENGTLEDIVGIGKTSARRIREWLRIQPIPLQPALSFKSPEDLKIWLVELSRPNPSAWNRLEAEIEVILAVEPGGNPILWALQDWARALDPETVNVQHRRMTPLQAHSLKQIRSSPLGFARYVIEAARLRSLRDPDNALAISKQVRDLSVLPELAEVDAQVHRHLQGLAAAYLADDYDVISKDLKKASTLVREARNLMGLRAAFDIRTMLILIETSVLRISGTAKALRLDEAEELAAEAGVSGLEHEIQMRRDRRY